MAPEVRVHVTGVGQFPHPLDPAAQFGQFRLAGPLDQEAREHRQEVLADLVDVPDVLEGGRGDPGPAARLHLDQPLLFEEHQRLADGGAAGVEPA